MKLCLFERIDRVTDNCHSEGGLVIIAKDRREAKKTANKYFDDNFDKIEEVGVTAAEWKSVKMFSLVGNHKPKVFTFPDAGCC